MAHRRRSRSTFTESNAFTPQSTESYNWIMSLVPVEDTAGLGCEGSIYLSPNDDDPSSGVPTIGILHLKHKKYWYQYQYQYQQKHESCGFVLGGIFGRIATARGGYLGYYNGGCWNGYVQLEFGRVGSCCGGSCESTICESPQQAIDQTSQHV
eukprot:scaffold126425_cov35-Attheya_sp.AAC.1